MALKTSTPRFAPRPIKTDICVIGAGVGGLAVASAAAQLGARTVLVDRQAPGGANLHTGTIPSNALIAAAKDIWNANEGGAFHVARRGWVDFVKVHDYVRSVVETVKPNVSPAHCRALGIRLIKSQARFKDRRSIMAGNQEIRARRFIVATGSRPNIPVIPGLLEVPFFTSDTLFDNAVRPDHLIIIGAGPFGTEMAQAYRRLGSRVTLLDAGRLLGNEDPEFATLVADRLRREGVEIFESTKIISVAAEDERIIVTLRDEEKTRSIRGSHLLIATGRVPNIETLNLDRAGIVSTPLGIKVDDRMRTANRRVFALGDVVGDVPGGSGRAHIATYQAEIIINNALFRVPSRTDYYALPRVTYTDPELAHVGETEAEARKLHKRINVLRWQLAENDRARAEKITEGTIKIITDQHSRILGATLFAPHAGELILPWVLARSQGLRLSAMTRLIMPYPTLSEISKRVAVSYYLPQLFSARTRALVRFLRFLG